MGNAALTNDSTPALDWGDVSGANLYHAQVSKLSDFSSLESENSALATSTYTPSAVSTDDSKYFWRWRSSTNAGATWGVWSEKYSFWYKSTFTATVTPTKWMLVATIPLALTDSYTFDVAPVYGIHERQVQRILRRNLAGGILQESVVVKAKITLVHNDAYIAKNQQKEILRFYNMGDAIYLLGAIDNETENAENAWKVVFASAPEMKMIHGREALFRTTLDFEEV